MNEPLVISTPNPSWIAIGTQIFRIFLFAATSVGFTWAQTVTGDQITQIVSSAIFLGTFAWSLWRTFAAAKREDKIAQINNVSMSGPPVQPKSVPV